MFGKQKKIASCSDIYSNPWSFLLICIQRLTEKKGETMNQTKYQTIADELKSKILSGDYPENTTIPPELQ